MDYLGNRARDNAFSFIPSSTLPRQHSESSIESITYSGIHSILPASLAIQSAEKTSYLNPHIWWWLGSSATLPDDSSADQQGENLNIQIYNDSVSSLLSHLPDIATFETIQGCSADLHSLPHLIMLSIHRNTMIPHIQYSLLKKLSRCPRNNTDQFTPTSKGSPTREGRYKPFVNITRTSRIISGDEHGSLPSL